MQRRQGKQTRAVHRGITVKKISMGKHDIIECSSNFLKHISELMHIRNTRRVNGSYHPWTGLAASHSPHLRSLLSELFQYGDSTANHTENTFIYGTTRGYYNVGR
jgi:hypothetical protein